MVPKSSKQKIKNQGLLPFEGNNISNLEFNFNSVTKEEFDKIIHTNNLFCILYLYLELYKVFVLINDCDL